MPHTSSMLHADADYDLSPGDVGCELGECRGGWVVLPAVAAVGFAARAPAVRACRVKDDATWLRIASRRTLAAARMRRAWRRRTRRTWLSSSNRSWRRNRAGFAPLPRRWVVERTFGWLVLHRRLVRDYETLPERSATMIYWAMISVEQAPCRRNHANLARPPSRTRRTITDLDQMPSQTRPPRPRAARACGQQPPDLQPQQG